MPTGHYNRKPHSQKTKEKIAGSLKGKVGVRGKKHGNWRGGFGMKGQMYAVKCYAKIRDDYTCQVCGLREPEIMEVDHMRPVSVFPEFKHTLENLVTLCPNCHKRKTMRDRKLYNW